MSNEQQPAVLASILRGLADRIDAEDMPQTADDVADFCDGARWATAQLRRVADEAGAGPVDGWLVGQAREYAPAALTEDERTMLRYALDLTQNKMWSDGEFTDEDQAAVDSLKRLAGEAVVSDD